MNKHHPNGVVSSSRARARRRGRGRGREGGGEDERGTSDERGASDAFVVARSRPTDRPTERTATAREDTGPRMR